MRDLMGDARRHRARFALARPAVPPVVRVLLATRGPTVLRRGDRTSLGVTVNPTIVRTRSVTRHAAAMPSPVRVASPGPAADRPVAPAVPGFTRVLDTRTATNRLDRVVTTLERRVVRTEERVPQVIRVLTHATTADPARQAGGARPDADGGRGAAASRPQVPAPSPPASLDLARITDHVLGAMDERLSAYTERLGRG